MRRINFNCHKSLQELEQSDWGTSSFDSHLANTCHRLRQVPLVQFTPDDLRIMIGQEVGLLFLVPLALEVLEQDPLIETTFYNGDLLATLLRVSETFWNTNYDFHRHLNAIVSAAISQLSQQKQTQEDDYEIIREVLSSLPIN